MLSVVIPVYNEQGNLGQLREELDAALQPYECEVIWVEDESTDGTSETIDEYAAVDERHRVVHLKRSYGQSVALAAGIDHAQGETIVTMDGDLQNHPKDIPQLVENLEEGYDCVKGWRRDRDDPWHKTIPSAIQTRLAKFTGPDINDFGCTLTAYRASALKDVELYGERHRYIPAQLHNLGYEVAELEVTHRARVNGDSRYGVSRLLRGFVDLVYHVFWVRYSTRPMQLLGSAGIISMVLGVLLGVVSVGQRYLAGVPLEPRTPRLILLSLLVVLGIQLLIFGALMEFLTTMHYANKRPYRIDYTR